MPGRTTAKINVYLKEGKIVSFLARVDRRKGIYMSRGIRDQLESGGCHEAQLQDRDGVVFSDGQMDRECTRTIIDFINGYDTYGDQAKHALSAKQVGSEDLVKLVRVHRAVHHFQIKKAMVGGVLRQEIVQCLRSKPISYKQFTTICQLADFDGGIFSAMLHAFVDFKLGGRPAQEVREIEAFISSIGSEQKMLNIEYFIQKSAQKVEKFEKVSSVLGALAQADQQPAAAPKPVPVWVAKPRMG